MLLRLMLDIAVNSATRPVSIKDIARDRIYRTSILNR